MVFFTCNACGESLKKNQVEKHYQFKCRNCEVLTCVDCHKDFPGDSYVKHTKCITEDEKYSAKGWQPKASANKGEKKQQEWISNLQNLMEAKSAAEFSPEVKNLLDTIMEHENIPRKKQKFSNFVKNIVRGIRPSVIEETWDIFEQALKPKAKAEPVPEKQTQEGEDGDDNEEMHRQGVKMFKGTKALKVDATKDKKKGRKRKADDEDAAMAEDSHEPQKKARKAKDDQESKENSNASTNLDDSNSNGPLKFNWENTIEALLKKKGEMKLNKLKKKVIAEYYHFHDGASVKSEQDLLAKVSKKLTKNKKFKVLKDSVSLSKDR